MACFYKCIVGFMDVTATVFGIVSFITSLKIPLPFHFRYSAFSLFSSTFLRHISQNPKQLQPTDFATAEFPSHTPKQPLQALPMR